MSEQPTDGPGKDVGGGHLDKYRQSLCEIDLYSLNQRLMQDRHFVSAFRIDMTAPLKEKIEFCRKNVMNMIFLFYGKPGTGKSYSALSLAKAIDPNFKVDTHCYWDLRKFIDDLNTLKDGGCYVIDEVARSWGEGSFRVLAEINTVFETVRKKQIFIIVCTPRYFYSPTWSFCFEGIPGQISFELEKSRMAIQDGDRKTMGFVLFNSPSLSLGKEELEKYEGKKDLFLDDVLHKGGGWFETKAKEVIDSEHFIKYIDSCKNNSMMPSTRGITTIVNRVFPYLNYNNESNTISNIILTMAECGEFGDLSEFKRSKSGYTKRKSGEDKRFVG